MRSSSRNDFDRQLVLWEIVTHEVATVRPNGGQGGSGPNASGPRASGAPRLTTSPFTAVTRAERARDEQFMRELGAMVEAARSDEVRTCPLPLAPREDDPMTKQRVTDFVRNLRQVSHDDSEIVALLAAYERGLEGKRAAAKAGLKGTAHTSALGRLRVLCDRLALLEQASSTMH